MLRSFFTPRRWLFGVLTVFAAAGCAKTPPPTIAEPGMDIRAVAIAGIEADKVEWQRAARWARRSLTHELRAAGAFDAVFDPAPAMPVDNAIVVRGRIEQHETLSGLGALGIGLGEAAVLAGFRIEDAEGRLLASFDAAASGSDEAVMPARDMGVAVGAEAARSILAWVRHERRLFAAANRGDPASDAARRGN